MSGEKTTDAEGFDAKVEREMLREGRQTAMRVAGVQVAFGIVAFALVLKLLGPALASATEIIADKGEHWYESLMPAVLTGIFGGLLGAGLGWRITHVSGLSGMPAFSIAAAAVLIVALAGLGIAAAALSVTLSAMTLVAAGVMVVAALGLISFFTLWSE